MLFAAEEPHNKQLMASIGNGYVATVVGYFIDITRSK
jgi:hypothetical protein